jgi:hypothetical protein
LGRVDDPFLELFLYEAVYGEVTAVTGYGEFIENLELNAEAMKGSSILAKPDSFTYKNIILTPPAYAHLKGVQPAVDIPESVARVTENKVMDIVAVLLVIVAVLTLFTDEKDSGMFTLTRTMQNGRGLLSGGKITALFLWCAAVVILLLSGGLALMSVKFGLGDLSRNIQSVNLFTGSILNISVGCYLLLFAAVKAISYFIVALIAATVCAVAKNSVFVYAVTGVIVGIETLLYMLISPLSVFGVLKFVNIIALTQPNGIFGNYFNINLFNQPLNIIAVSAVTGVVLIAGLLITVFTLSKHQVITIWNSNFLSDFLSRFSNRKIHVNVFRHEMYKTFIYNKAVSTAKTALSP